MRGEFYLVSFQQISDIFYFFWIVDNFSIFLAEFDLGQQLDLLILSCTR